MNRYDHQQDLIERNPNKELLCWDTGTGKSRAAVEWSHLKEDPTMIICPKGLLKNWVREYYKWTDDKGGPADDVIHEAYKDRRYHNTNHNVMIITKEKFRSDWKELPYFPTVIVDEAHYFAGTTSKMSKSLRYYINRHETPNILLLTATPYRSTPWDVYRLAGHLGYKWRYKTFQEKFFKERWLGNRKVHVPKSTVTNKNGNIMKTEEAIAQVIRNIGSVVDINECADVPDQVFKTEYFDMRKEQKRARNNVDDINHIVKFTKYHQIENGTLKGDEYEDSKSFKADKHDRIKEFAQDNDKVAVVCRYNLQIDHLKEFLSGIDKDIYVIRGATKDRDAVVTQAEEADECVVLINAACSEGYELPSINLIVFASLSFSYVHYKQMRGRFLRMNKLSKNVFVHLITTTEGEEGSIDEAVYDSIKKKEDFDIEIYSKRLFGDDAIIENDGISREGFSERLQ